MSKVILLNSGDKGKGSNFFKTIENSVEIEKLSKFISEFEFRKLSENIQGSTVQVWAVTSKAGFDKFLEEDCLLFCANNIYHTKATIAYKLKSPNEELAKYLWGSNKFSYILFLKDVEAIAYARSQIQRLANVGENLVTFASKIVGENESREIFEFLNEGYRIGNDDYVIQSFNENIVDNSDPSDDTDTLGDNEQLLEKGGPVIGVGGGADAQSDSIATVDKLGRSTLIEGLSHFYRGYTLNSVKPFFLGVFGGWGRGKSSFVEMLIQSIKEEEGAADEVVHVISKIDTSLMDKKDAVWLSILSQVIDDVEEKKSTSRMFKGILKRWNFRKPWNLYKLNATKIEFNFKNLMKWAWIKKGVLTTYTLLAIVCVSVVVAWIGPTKIFSFSDGKNIAGWLTLLTVIITFIKTLEAKAGGVFLNSHNKKQESLFFKSKDEFKQLVKMLSKNLKKDKSLRVLVVLDEVDRMNKDLITELIEVIQLFKGIQDFGKKDEKNKVALNFLFSFNHEIVFPSIGNAISQCDDDLLVDSFSKDMISNFDKKNINRYKLGKEYMDKYLDLSVYLDGQMDLDSLVDALFMENQEEEETKGLKIGSIKEDSRKIVTNPQNQTLVKNSGPKPEGDSFDIPNEDNGIPQSNEHPKKEENSLNLPVFTEEEISIIKQECLQDIDPRKIIRLKNTLLLLRMLNTNLQEDELTDKYHDELRRFVRDYLNKEHVEDLENHDAILKGKDFFMDKKRYAPPKENEDKVEEAV